MSRLGFRADAGAMASDRPATVWPLNVPDNLQADVMETMPLPHVPVTAPAEDTVALQILVPVVNAQFPAKLAVLQLA